MLAAVWRLVQHPWQVWLGVCLTLALHQALCHAAHFCVTALPSPLPCHACSALLLCAVMAGITHRLYAAVTVPRPLLGLAAVVAATAVHFVLHLGRAMGVPAGVRGLTDPLNAALLLYAAYVMARPERPRVWHLVGTVATPVVAAQLLLLGLLSPVMAPT